MSDNALSVLAPAKLNLFPLKKMLVILILRRIFFKKIRSLVGGNFLRSYSVGRFKKNIKA